MLLDKLRKLQQDIDKVILVDSKLFNKESLKQAKAKISGFIKKIEKDQKLNESLNSIKSMVDKKDVNRTDEIVRAIRDMKIYSDRSIADEIRKITSYIARPQSDENLGKALLKIAEKEPKDRTDEIVKAIKEIKFPSIEFPDKLPVHIMGTEVVQKIPQPVTNISINSVNGYIHSTKTTVTTDLTTLPEYGVLDNRRSLIIFNNDSSTTLFIGGSDLTAGVGMPVPPKTYSPPFDAGKNTILYGRVSAGSIDVRVLEISDIAIGR